MAEKCAIITGASSGIGYEYAREMARRGYNLVMVGIEDEALKEKAAVIRGEFSVEVDAVVMDLGRQEAAGELYGYCRQKGMEVEVLINNAGVYHDRDFIKDSEDFNSTIMMLHMYTPAMLVYYFGKDMAARGKGYILNMSSIVSEIAIQRMATYSSTKAFLKNFSRSTHIELKGFGVNVCCVRPGAVATNLYSLKPGALRTGLALGYIITPENLARKGVRALFKGRAQITPGLSSKLLVLLAGHLPICVLKSIRRFGIF